ncbi:1390_t:CDS:2 [Dentiscutata erythropus]|uniref:1390_t:CDS:1 n=1 Tax=Dentiscutata erythropus TaxID=1348616 RepID=A0A9N9CG85_9GLOM|nr:1390_t:CDS:2 [Dentiscutata erythropus]
MMNSLLKTGLLKTLSKDLCHLLDEAIESNVLITVGTAIDMLVTLEILIATDELCLTELADYIIDYLFDNQSWMRENFILIYQTAFLKGSFKDLQLFCLEIIEKTPDIIFKAKDFTDTDPKLLVALLEHSNLLTPEIEVWDALIEWGTFNTSPPLDIDNTIWSNESFEKLQETLQQFIPLINFTVISSSDFYHRIIPFQRILPNDLYDDLLKFHLAPQINPSHPFLPIRNTHGPSFGDGDLWVKVTCVGKNVTLPSFCRPRSYDRRIFDLEQFHVEDYEVFQIVRKTTVIYL